MRIAIIGAGVSGNVCAHLLNDSHDVMLFESNGYAGGHTNTVDVEAYGRHFTVDTGFMVFNDRTYPNFVRLLAHLGVASQASDMSFSVRCDRTGWEYQGSSLSGLFAQRRNLFRPAFYRMLCDIVRFNRRATEVRDGLDDGLTLGEFLEGHRYGRHLRSHYLLPMTAAIWSAPPSRILEMPARFLFQFFHNHGLLQLTDRPQWRTISGGARRYVKAMLEPLGDRVRLETPIQAVRRFDDHVTVTPRGGSPEVFDAVVFACHSDQALGMLVDPTTQERELLSQFAYQRNVAILHTDASLMPRRPAAWASWNYHVPLDEQGTVAVTYDLNRLQRLGAPGPICVTLNDCERIAPRHLARNRLPASRLRAGHAASPAAACPSQRPESHLLLRCVLGIRFPRGWCGERAGCWPLFWSGSRFMQSCLYTGHVRHRRFESLGSTSSSAADVPRELGLENRISANPLRGRAGRRLVKHEFRYSMAYLYLDLDELADVVSQLPLLSRRAAWSVSAICREDHLGDPQLDLATAVRAEVYGQTGLRTEGPIRMLTVWRSWGWFFSPVSFFFCFAPGNSGIDAIVAEVNNTPWRERHCYVLWSGNQVDATRLAFEHAKDFHVSPFLEMDLRYRWHLTPPSESLTIHLAACRGEADQLDATLTLRRQPLSTWNWLRCVVRYPLVPMRILTAIHYEALRLWIKKAPFFPHPGKRPPAHGNPSNARPSATKIAR